MANPNPIPPPPELRWKPGQSGNPKGYSRGRRQVDDMIALIEETAGAERAISKAWLKQILNGSFVHLREYLERKDGKVPTVIETSDKPSVDWSELDNEGDTERPSVSSARPKSLPEGGEA